MCNLTLAIQLSAWKVNNMVIRYNFNRRFKFHNVMCNHYFSFEPELFPAALISRWNPAHVTLFPNGNCMLTGIKSKEALSILAKVPVFLQEVSNFPQ